MGCFGTVMAELGEGHGTSDSPPPGTLFEGSACLLPDFVHGDVDESPHHAQVLLEEVIAG